jgi:hypothetical protein
MLGSGFGSKFLAWTFAEQGQRVATIERKYLGGSCPNIACLPSKNIIHSAKVASYFRRGKEFGISTDGFTVNMSAVRDVVTRNATVLDWPTSPGGEYRVLWAGTNGWTCLPGLPRTPHDEPGCFDQVFLQFIKDSMAGRTPNVQSVGISYMYGGFWVPNKSHAMGTGDEFYVGPHIMIIGPDQKMLETLNRDGSNGEPYVNHLPGRTELRLSVRRYPSNQESQSAPCAKTARCRRQAQHQISTGKLEMEKRAKLMLPPIPPVPCRLRRIDRAVVPCARAGTRSLATRPRLALSLDC